MNAFGQPIIGVIGGAGVAAGVQLAANVEESVTALGGYRDAHHPELILWQATSAPSRSLFLEGRGPDFTPDYVAIGQHLKACHADVFCMACNSAHRHAADISRAVGLPMIHLLDELFDTVRGLYPGVQRIGMLSSTGARDCRIFDDAAVGLDLISADDEIQQQITNGICGVKCRNRSLPETHPNRPRVQFLDACRHMVRRGAQVVVLACADIRVDFPLEEVDGIPVVDSMTVLADAIVRYWLKQGKFDPAHPLFEESQKVKGQR